MLDVMGSGYVIDHCVAACNKQRQRDNYEIYMTDCAYMVLKYLNNGEEVFTRYWDAIHPIVQKQKSGEEIADDIIKRHGLKVVG